MNIKNNQIITGFASHCNSGINLITSNPNSCPEAFCLVGSGFDNIQKNSKLTELFLRAKHALFPNEGELYKKKLSHAVQNNVKFLNSNRNRVGFVTEKGYSDSFLVAQRYNHFIKMAATEDKTNFHLFKELKLTELTMANALPIIVIVVSRRNAQFD